MPDRIRKRFVFFGNVQGVGFRWRARQAAAAAGASGWVRNDLRGSVTLELQGSREQIDAVLAAIERGRYIRIEDVEAQSLPLEPGERGFTTRDE